MITITVADSGIGIAPESMDLIFRPFEQEDQTERRRYEGLGLGLSISREVAMRHGGSLTVESFLGRGSTFYCRLPYKIRRHQDFRVLTSSAGNLPLMDEVRTSVQEEVRRAIGDDHHSETASEDGSEWSVKGDKGGGGVGDLLGEVSRGGLDAEPSSLYS